MEQAKYTKQQILKSKRYYNQRDILSALLKDDITYSHNEISKLIEKFMKSKVK